MPETGIDHQADVVERLAAEGYWVAVALERLREGRYSDSIRICREHFSNAPNVVSGRLAYATALHLSGQTEQAADEFHHVLALDPDNLAALKYLGDICFKSGSEGEAMAYYSRILEIDPDCRGLKSPIRKTQFTTTRTITLARGPETGRSVEEPALRKIPFYTETMGDLYMNQGHNRLAAEVYRRLNHDGGNPRLAEKLARAEGNISEKERES